MAESRPRQGIAARTKPGDPRSVLALQRRVGNSGVIRLLAGRPSLARQTPPAWEDYQPPRTGPQEGKKPPFSGGGLVWKNGKPYWHWEGLPIPDSPDIPLDPRDIPGEIEGKIPKDSKGPKPPPGGPDFGTRPKGPFGGPDLPPNWLQDICKRDPRSPVCLPGLSTPQPGPSSPLPPVGVFYTFDVLFEHDRPTAGDGSGSGMTPAGEASLKTIAGMLAADPTLQVRLVGHASSEGTAPQNLELSKRRAQTVNAGLAAQGLGARVMDFVGGEDPPGCSKLEFGVWACGASQASPDEARPEDRKVAVTLLRNRPFTLTPSP